MPELSEPFTLRNLLHVLTEDYLHMDEPVTVDQFHEGEWITMEVVGVRSWIGAGGKPRQALELRRQGQK